MWYSFKSPFLMLRLMAFRNDLPDTIIDYCLNRSTRRVCWKVNDFMHSLWVSGCWIWIGTHCTKLICKFDIITRDVDTNGQTIPSMQGNQLFHIFRRCLLMNGRYLDYAGRWRDHVSNWAIIHIRQCSWSTGSLAWWLDRWARIRSRNGFLKLWSCASERCK